VSTVQPILWVACVCLCVTLAPKRINVIFVAKATTEIRYLVLDGSPHLPTEWQTSKRNKSHRSG